MIDLIFQDLTLIFCTRMHSGALNKEVKKSSTVQDRMQIINVCLETANMMIRMEVNISKE